MSRFDFIKNYNLLYWNDPDNGKSTGDYIVISAPEEVYEDSIILIASDYSEAEVLASELTPIPPTRSHKEEFQKWREKHEAEGAVFYTNHTGCVKVRGQPFGVNKYILLTVPSGISDRL